MILIITFTAKSSENRMNMSSFLLVLLLDLLFRRKELCQQVNDFWIILLSSDFERRRVGIGGVAISLDEAIAAKAD